jgi:hypothetical protein
VYQILLNSLNKKKMEEIALIKFDRHFELDPTDSNLWPEGYGGDNRCFFRTKKGPSYKGYITPDGDFETNTIVYSNDSVAGWHGVLVEISETDYWDLGFDSDKFLQ